MFNRNNQPQSMSHFIKGQILEEDDLACETLKHESDLTNADTGSLATPETCLKSGTGKLDEDFMFQMDRGLFVFSILFTVVATIFI